MVQEKINPRFEVYLQHQSFFEQYEGEPIPIKELSAETDIQAEVFHFGLKDVKCEKEKIEFIDAIHILAAWKSIKSYINN